MATKIKFVTFEIQKQTFFILLFTRFANLYSMALGLLCSIHLYSSVFYLFALPRLLALCFAVYLPQSSTRFKVPWLNTVISLYSLLIIILALFGIQNVYFLISTLKRAKNRNFKAKSIEFG